MATYIKFNSFVEALAEKAHNLGSDQLKVALCATANAPVAGNTVLANLTEIAYTNLSSRDLTTVSSAQTSGTYKLVLDDLTLTVSGGSVAAFQYIVIYNDTASNKELIGFYDYGSSVVLADGDQFILDFSAVNGVIQIV
jgi:hypothetical protein